MKNALVVDDSSVMRRIHQKALEKLGWQVSMAEDGQDALNKLALSGPCTLLLTDLHMPNMDGMQLIEAVRKEAKFSATKIMMITSDGVVDVAQQAIALGANDILFKPFTPAVFEERLQALLDA